MARAIFRDEQNNIVVYRADKLDVNDNSRHIVHFLDFLTEEEQKENDVLQGYALAHKKIKKYGYGWRKYTCREFGGGFITQGDYAEGKGTASEVLNIRNNKKWNEK